MTDLSLIADLRKRYIELTKQFFSALDSGKSVNDLQELQQQIEQLMVQMDRLENPGTASS